MKPRDPRISQVFEAAEQGDVARLRALLGEEASLVHAIYGPYLEREQPLHTAAHAGQLEAVKVLIEFGADINNPGDLGRTPVAMAANSEKASMVRFLLRRGAKPNIVDDIDNRAIHYVAMRSGDEELYREMIGHGASEDARSRLHMWGPDALLRELIDHPGKIKIGKMEHLVYDVIRTVFGGGPLLDHLLNHGAKLSAGWNGEVPLYAAVLSNNVDAVRILLRHGADPTQSNAGKRSVLELVRDGGIEREIVAAVKKYSRH